MTEKVGIAVSLYDKFDDLAVLHDILRHNFEGDYILSVHCNHPEAKEEIIEKRNLDLDYFSYGEEVKYKEGAQKVMRILNSIKKSCSNAMQDSDYVMHLHADAWVLEEDKLHEIIENMEKKDRKLTFRGRGNTYVPVSGPYFGQTMDQFFVFESEYSEKVGFFDYNLLDPLPHMGIHNAIMLLFLGKIGRSKMWRFSDFSNDIYYDGQSTSEHSTCRPSVYNEKWGLFHCARDEFPNDYGKEIQAERLREENLANGDHIEELLSNYNQNRNEICDELSKIEKRQNFKLRLLLANPDKFERRFSDKEDIINQDTTRLIKFAGKNLFKRVYFGANNLFFSILPFENPAKTRNEQKRGSYWPETTEEVYKEELNEKEINSENLWFSNQT